MGQYYKLVNVDKREMLEPHRWKSGAKLMEFAYTRGEFAKAFCSLVDSRWNRDRVYVVGDYADLEDYDGDSKNWHDTLKKLYAEFKLPEPYVGSDGKTYYRGLYDYAEEHFKSVLPGDDVGNVPKRRYLINDGTRQYVDLKKLPINSEGDWIDDNGAAHHYRNVIDPLILLLAMGNGRGGGDFSSETEAFGYAGLWVPFASSVRYSDDPPGGYALFAPDFEEIHTWH